MEQTHSHHILIVDDDVEICRALNTYLSNEGYNCTFAHDGATALAMLDGKQEYSIILLDISMNGIDGITVLKHLQSTAIDAAVIMMSGHGSEELAVECMRNGADDYVVKPFSSEDILQRIIRADNSRKARVEKRLLQQEREDFILMLSHDMKNPLTAVIGSIDIIREGCLGSINEEQEDYLQSAIDSCNEVVTMIDNLLDIRKFEAGKIRMSPQPCNVHELLSKVAAQFSRPAQHDGISLTVNIQCTGADITVDRNSFTRIIGNLLGNALKFTPEGGTISISCNQIPGAELSQHNIPAYVTLTPELTQVAQIIKITVHDTGNGIALEELEQIFDRYTQFSRKSGKERGGAGLGLAYCKLAIDSFHGVIWAESDAQNGSSFIMLFPGSHTLP